MLFDIKMSSLFTELHYIVSMLKVLVNKRVIQIIIYIYTFRHYFDKYFLRDIIKIHSKIYH